LCIRRLQAEDGVAPAAATARDGWRCDRLVYEWQAGMLENGIWPLSQFLTTPDLIIGTVLPPTTDSGNRVDCPASGRLGDEPAAADKDTTWSCSMLDQQRAAEIRGRSGFSLRQSRLRLRHWVCLRFPSARLSMKQSII